MSVASPSFNVLSLFSGVGGLDLGFRRVVPTARTVCYLEREAYAASVLVARGQEGLLDRAPIWSDVSTFDGRPWRGKVDCIIGGFPCQDISNAGKRAGILEGNRSGLWFEYARIIDEVRPSFVFIENVAALAKRGLDIVLRDLDSLGFYAEWGVYSAAEAGAPHRRERLFVLANNNNSGREVIGGGGIPNGDTARRNDLDGCSGQDSEVAHADVTGLEGRHGLGHASKQPPWPPGPADTDGWREYLKTWPGLEPSVLRGPYGMANRVDRLRACGNGVVPAQAALALRDLARRSGLNL